MIPTKNRPVATVDTLDPAIFSSAGGRFRYSLGLPSADAAISPQTRKSLFFGAHCGVTLRRDPAMCCQCFLFVGVVWLMLMIPKFPTKGFNSFCSLRFVVQN